MQKMSSNGCYCYQLTAHRLLPLTAWDDFGSEELNVNKQKESSSVKGRKQLVQRGRYGYETLEDKYKFCHHEDLEKYIEEYRDMFCVANRGHKKGWKPNGISYNYLRMAPPARYVIV